jgi:amidophosphoribosyltransferase
MIAMLRDAGAKEVHMRVSSPPDKWPCFYGIDTADQGQLIAANNSVEEIRKYIGADSLSYLSLEGLVKATGGKREDFCLACFDGNYPIEVPEDLKITKLMLEEEHARNNG